MATHADFSESDWQILQWAVTDTMTYLSLADSGFWDAFKEAGAAAKYLNRARTESSSLLVRDLASDIRSPRDKEVTQSRTNMAGELSERLREAVAIVGRVAPDELDAFREFVLGVGQAAAEAAGGLAEVEVSALEDVRAALLG